MSKTHLIIDGDLYLYQASTVVEQEFDFGDDLWGLSANVQDAAIIVDGMVKRLCASFKDAGVIFARSSDRNFRKEVLPTYKANRKGLRKPVCYRALWSYVEDTYKVIQWEGLEADDVMGILASGTRPAGDRVLVTIDKDLRTVPGLHLNPDKEDEPVRVSQEEADNYFLRQALMGDSTDGYSGCPGIGTKTADKILSGVTTVEEGWPLVVETYESKGLTEADAIVQARCARILRAEDYVKKTGRVKLWEPPQ